jgi:hypothetical protein
VNRSCFLSFAVFRTPSNPWDMRFPLGVGCAWTSYQTAQLAHCKKPLRGYASVAWKDFNSHPMKNWREACTIRRSELERWVNDPKAIAHTKKWFSEWAANKAKHGSSAPFRLKKYI